MIYHKSLLSAWFLAQAFIQISVSADEPRTKVQLYTGPAVTHSVNGAVTICDKNGCVTTLNKDISDDHSINVYPERNEVVFTIVKCKSDIYPTCDAGYQKCNSEQTGYDECVNGKLVFRQCNSDQFCVALNGNVAGCAARNDVSKCTDGATRCAVGNLDSETCYNGKWVIRKCSGDELCKINIDNVAGCAKINVPEPTCDAGYQKCNSEQTGYDECVNGKLVFRQCNSDQFCVALNGNGIDSETCSNGKWVRRKCSGNEECRLAEVNVYRCVNINVPECTEGASRCNPQRFGSETCFEGKWAFRKCGGNEDCRITEGNVAKCVDPNPPAPSCKNGDQKCNSEQTGYDECIDGRLTFKPCGSNQKCYALNGPRVLCGGSNIVPECTDGQTRCAVGNLDSETCYNGKWVIRKCSGDELCKINIDNVAGCAKINVPEPACDAGYQKCNSEQTGYDECVNGKLVFRQCNSDQFCVALNGNVAGCAARNNV
ncbi:hypothetical protein BB561_006783 [Smittium simulii]|uniref:Uncharacterized protein n=1 Tax=Smittium simulii TaxID=133385 RepID=A0A2T9Y1N2_9FUNG|nr:hypothetical protein BB561_006783 [Smittium simulii]